MTRKEYALYFAWLVATVAMLGSLYFSEIKGYIPCELCWYQRIAMYPLAIMLGVAAYRGDLNIQRYALPLASIGLFISIFHYLEQKVPGFATIRPCKQGIPCNFDYIDWLGFITIPFLAGVAFILIIAALLFIRSQKEVE